MVNAICVSDGGWVKVVNKKGAKGWVPHNFIVQMNQDELETTRKAVEVLYKVFQCGKLSMIYDRMTQAYY